MAFLSSFSIPAIEHPTFGQLSPPHFTRRIPPGVSPDGSSIDARFNQGFVNPALDAHFFVFASKAKNLGFPNLNGIRRVYRAERDPGGGVFLREVSGPVAQDCKNPSISEDGNIVVFTTTAALAVIDDNNLSDVYVKFMDTGTIRLVSAHFETNGLATEVGDAQSLWPNVSGNGRFIAFTSEATNLLLPFPDENGSKSDVFIVELVFNNGVFQQFKPAEIVSVGNLVFNQSIHVNFTGFHTHGAQTGGAGSEELPVPRFISHDGTRVVFTGRPCDWLLNLCPALEAMSPDEDCNITPDCTSECTLTTPSQVYIRFRDTGTTALLSAVEKDLGMGVFRLEAGNRPSTAASISPSGVFVVYSSRAQNLKATGANDLDTISDIFRTSGEIPPNPLKVTAGANSDSFNPAVIDYGTEPDNGNRVGFQSIATNLVPGDTNGKSDIFVFDVPDVVGIPVTKRRFSVNSAGQQSTGAAAGDSVNPDLSADGRLALYESLATALIASDTNGKRDVFETLSPQGEFIRGDANDDGVIDLSDFVFTQEWLFVGGSPAPCWDAGDVDDTGIVDLTDVIYSQNFQFFGGPAPPAPFPGCGFDNTGDALPCGEQICQ